jgi:hypothetical protein
MTKLALLVPALMVGGMVLAKVVVAQQVTPTPTPTPTPQETPAPTPTPPQQVMPDGAPVTGMGGGR